MVWHQSTAESEAEDGSIYFLPFQLLRILHLPTTLGQGGYILRSTRHNDSLHGGYVNIENHNYRAAQVSVLRLIH